MCQYLKVVPVPLVPIRYADNYFQFCEGNLKALFFMLFFPALEQVHQHSNILNVLISSKCVFILSRIFEGAWQFTHSVHICSVDLEKAFNHIPRSVLWGGSLGVWGVQPDALSHLFSV